MKKLLKIPSFLREYCENSSLAGISYTVDESLHWTEKVFWGICVSITTLFCYQTTKAYFDLFEKSTISLVVDTWEPTDTSNFPSIGVCEIGYERDSYPGIDKAMEMLKAPGKDVYDFNKEEYLFNVIFHNLYKQNSLQSFCNNKCENCVECPINGSEILEKIIKSKCSEIFQNCSWNGKSFDCCDNFLPIPTSIGVCFVIGSMQSRKIGKNSSHLDMQFGLQIGHGHLQVDFNRSVEVHILNEGEIPQIFLPFLKEELLKHGEHLEIKLQIVDVINDPDIRRISPELRKCLLPDETTNTLYEFYSISVCLTECISFLQLKECNCTSHNFKIKVKFYKTGQICPLEGYFCLDEKDILYPRSQKALNEMSDNCSKCLPSCNERNMIITERRESKDEQNDIRSISIALANIPRLYYKRITVRTNLDIVVSVGGIFGLFLGASILSLVEIVYYFVIKLLELFI